MSSKRKPRRNSSNNRQRRGPRSYLKRSPLPPYPTRRGILRFKGKRDRDIKPIAVNVSAELYSRITEIIKYLRYSQKAAGIEVEPDEEPEEEEEYES